jgi:hypothetical protein
MEETGNQELRKRMKKRTKVEDGRRGPRDGERKEPLFEGEARRKDYTV